jgi:hypothetical protein
MTEEFRLLKRLFAEDTEPGEGAWAKLRRRIGSAGEATPGGSSSHSTPVDPVAGHSGALASAGGAAAGAEGVAVAGALTGAGAGAGALAGAGSLAGAISGPEAEAGVDAGGHTDAPVIWLDDAREAKAKRPRSVRRRLVVVGVAASVLAAFGTVAAGAFARQDAVHAAFASLFGSPTLEVVFSAQASDPHTESTVSQYSVAVTVTSENGSQPLSGSDGTDNFEVSVYRSGVDLGDVLVADGAVYGRLNLQGISAADYGRATASIARQIPGPESAVASAFINDQWVGIDDATLKSVVDSFDSSAKPVASDIDGVRNAVSTSFAQSWETWASIHQLSSANGTTEYSLEMPLRNFVSTFVDHVTGALVKVVPGLKADLPDLDKAIMRIPASTEIPMTMWVTNGSLSQLDISYQGNALDMAISHPANGVAAPAGAVMVTSANVEALESDYHICSAAQAQPIGNNGGALCSAYISPLLLDPFAAYGSSSATACSPTTTTTMPPSDDGSYVVCGSIERVGSSAPSTTVQGSAINAG